MQEFMLVFIDLQLKVKLNLPPVKPNLQQGERIWAKSFNQITKLFLKEETN